jgi:hypothetical protein
MAAGDLLIIFAASAWRAMARWLSVGLVKPYDLHPLLSNFAFAKALEAPEHTL